MRQRLTERFFAVMYPGASEQGQFASYSEAVARVSSLLRDDKRTFMSGSIDKRIVLVEVVQQP